MTRRYQTYCDSGCEWLGDLPSHWRTTPLHRLVSYRTSGVDKKSKADEIPVRLCNYTDVYYSERIRAADGEYMAATATGHEVERFGLRPGDVIITKDSEDWRDIGVPALVEDSSDDFVCGYHLGIVRAGAEIDSGYLFRALLSDGVNKQLQVAATGVTRYGIPNASVESAVLPLPPLDEQRAIAAHLDRDTARIDRLITLQESLIERLDEYRTALVTRVVTKGLPPEAAEAAGLDPEPALKDSRVEWLGEVPEHWEVCPLRRMLAEPLAYGANEPADIDDPSYPRYVRITDIDAHDSLRPETFRSLPPEVAAPYLLREGDLLLARSGATVGKTFLYRTDWGPCAYAGYLIRARLDTSTADTHFVRYFTSSAAYWAWLGSAYIQATIQNVSAERYANLDIALPSIHEQRAIVDYLDASTEHIDALRAKAELSIERLLEYRLALISAAVTGKVDVRDVAASDAGGG